MRGPFVQLFDLSNDLHEDINLSTKYPDKVEQMITLLKAQIENGRSTPGPKLKNDKNVKIIHLKDRRLPPFVRDRIE